MGAGAKVNKLALLKKAELGVGRQVVNQLYFIRLLPLLH